ncbi:Hypothetical Protein FCC1311_013722 [Hondaea fermentalgiana]|uniref:Uncharacterized protein n=1 Tax=Hondaea fermentalgiana TaxID=2315210 RepID=A0A2R5G3P6_9STRA|nr:Hypothetical Protein FCC1311_013722 [Hondaea fermentalgiana]|eukprot:GBG25155.1 Hypothetical Protein FCC1311_013722 [Hondaea fermentalgiana]
MPSQKENPAFVAMYKQEFGLHVVWQKVSLEDLAEHENYFHGRCPDSMLAKGVKNFLDCLCDTDEEAARRDAVLKYGGHVARALFVSSMPETVRVACFEYMLHSRMCFKLRNNGNGFYVKALKDWLYSQTFHKYVERWIAFGTTFKVSTQSGSRKGQKRGRASAKNSSAPPSAAAAAAAAAATAAAAAAGGSPATSPSAGALGVSAGPASAFASGHANFSGPAAGGYSGAEDGSGAGDDDSERASRNGGGSSTRGSRGGRGRGGASNGNGAKGRKRQAQESSGLGASGFASIKIPVFGASDNEEDHQSGGHLELGSGGNGHTPDDAVADAEAEAETELIDSEGMGDEDAHVPLKLQVRQLKRRFVMQESTLQVLQSRFTLLERVNMQQQAIINQLVSQAVMQAKVQADMQQVQVHEQMNGMRSDPCVVKSHMLSQPQPQQPQQQSRQLSEQQSQQTSMQVDRPAAVKAEGTMAEHTKFAPVNSALPNSAAAPSSTPLTSPSGGPQQPPQQSQSDGINLVQSQSQSQPQAQTTTEAVAALAQ